jgi:acetoacetate decarboxylase
MEYYDKSRAVGWGNSKEGEENYGALRHMTGTMITKEFCIEFTRSRKIELANHMICAFPFYGGLCQVCKYFGANKNSNNLRSCVLNLT